jgi:hypothetical protein
LFASPPPDEQGNLLFRPVSQGIGFTSHHAVCRIPLTGNSGLVGPSADGIRAFTGASTIELLDRWDRILPKGVNPRRLSQATAAASLSDTLYFLAVPSSGSDVNDRLIVYDWSKQRWWVWSCPFGGISYISKDILESGQETILFGHNDGTVSTLGGKQRDGFAEITASMRTYPISPDNNRTVAFTGLMLQTKELGDTPTVTIRTHINRGRIPVQSGELTLQASGVNSEMPFQLSGSDSDPVDIAGTLARDAYVKKRVHIPSGTSGTAFDYAIESSARFRLRSASLIAIPKGQRHEV